MSQYTELKDELIRQKEEIHELRKVTETLTDVIIALQDYSAPEYMTVESIPEWARPAIEKLVSAGVINGDEQGNLNLSESDIRLYTILSRLNIY